MTVEAATTLAELDELLPDNDDPVSEGDEHLRLLKTVIKNVFPGDLGAGFDQQIAAYETELNFVNGVASLIQDQLDDLHLGKIPVNGIIMYSGTIASIPSNFKVCDGSNGTPNLVNQIVYGTNTEGDVGVTGGNNGALIQSHTHNFSHGHPGSSLVADGEHSHQYQTQGLYGGGSGDIGIGTFTAVVPTYVATSANGGHGHTTTINSDNTSLGDALDPGTSQPAADGTNQNLPPYVRLAHIMRVS